MRSRNPLSSHRTQKQGRRAMVQAGFPLIELGREESIMGLRTHCDSQGKGPHAEKGAKQRAELTGRANKRANESCRDKGTDRQDRQMGQIPKDRSAAGLELWDRPNKEMSRETQPVVGRCLLEHPPLVSQIQGEKL